jgi:hypothetical protein
MKLDIGESHVLKINPALKWQDTEINITVNEEYKFTATGTWIDFFIVTNADGFSGKWIMPKSEKKRAPENNWLALMGSLNESETDYFLIGKEKQKLFEHAGRLSCFANDMKDGGFFLRNNWGSITLTITRIK